jgi:hypothetical protein
MLRMTPSPHGEGRALGSAMVTAVLPREGEVVAERPEGAAAPTFQASRRRLVCSLSLHLEGEGWGERAAQTVHTSRNPLALPSPPLGGEGSPRAGC